MHTNVVVSLTSSGPSKRACGSGQLGIPNQIYIYSTRFSSLFIWGCYAVSRMISSRSIIELLSAPVCCLLGSIMSTFDGLVTEFPDIRGPLLRNTSKILSLISCS